MFPNQVDGLIGLLPTILALHFDTAANHKRVKLFWTAFGGMFLYEILPAYMFPLLNGVNVVCLASQKASSKTRDIITNLFGGTDGNEGMGFLSISFDWQYISSAYVVSCTIRETELIDFSRYMSLPLIQQANSWIGFFFCYIIVMAIYYSNIWNVSLILPPFLKPLRINLFLQSLAFPMLSTSIFSANGSIYHQSAVFGPQFQLNETALQEVGLPALTGSNAWKNLASNLAVCF